MKVLFKMKVLLTLSVILMMLSSLNAIAEKNNDRQTQRIQKQIDRTVKSINRKCSLNVEQLAQIREVVTSTYKDIFIKFKEIKKDRNAKRKIRLEAIVEMRIKILAVLDGVQKAKYQKMIERKNKSQRKRENKKGSIERRSKVSPE